MFTTFVGLSFENMCKASSPVGRARDKEESRKNKKNSGTRTARHMTRFVSQEFHNIYYIYIYYEDVENTITIRAQSM